MKTPEFLIINTHRQNKPYRNPTGDWLGIHYIAAFLNENGIKTLAFAGYAHEVPQLLEDYLNSRELKAIGFSCDYENQSEVITFCNRVRRQSNIPIIVGGPQAAFLDEDFFCQTDVAAVVCGEGELTTLDLLNSLFYNRKLNEVSGIKFMEGGHLITTPPRPLITNLDALPFPDSKYALGTLFRPTIASFLTGRGCPYSCSFCYEGGNTKGVRWRSVDNVCREINQVLEKRPDIHYIMFTDDTFTVDEKRVRDFCKKLKNLRRKFDFNWFCEGHVQTLYGKKDLLHEMIDAGLSCLQIGIESGDDEVLKAYNKNITAVMIEHFVQDAYDAGLEQLWGNIILGGALETPERIRNNMDFCRRLYEKAPGMINMDVVYFWPLPGTKITMNPEKFGMKILDIASKTSTMDYPVVEYSGISVKDFCEYRRDFIDLLETTAKQLLASISIERCKNIVKQQNRSGNFSIWQRLLLQNDTYVKFFSLLNCGAAVLSSEVSEKMLKTTHPMRTVALEYFDSEGRLIVDKRICTKEETLILCSASGKLNWVELQKSQNFSEKRFKEILLSLESKRLLTFSKY